MDYYHENTVLYHDGEYLKASEVKVDLYGQTLHYGYGVFEGIRAYKTEDGRRKIFKAAQHYDRLRNSANALNIPYKYSTSELIEATYEVLAKNNLQDAYIRPLVYAPANMSFARNNESHIMIAVW